MYSTEKLFKSLTLEELFLTLEGFMDNDYYLEDFVATKVLQDFLYLLKLNDLIFLASDDRILLTPKGEKLLYKLSAMLI